MDVPDNYYAILGVPVDADEDTLKRAYRQLARRYHPDLAGEEGASGQGDPPSVADDRSVESRDSDSA